MDVRISARISRDQHKKLNKMAERGYNKSAVIRAALAKYLDEQ